jgi:DNA-binding MarR family transcriptional regulator
MQAIDAATHASVEQTTEHLRALARFLMGATGANFMREVERLGLSMPQMKILYVLEAEDGLTIKAISDRLGLSEPAVSRGVESLVKGELVKRTDDPTDRRCKRVSTTSKGIKVVAAVEQVRTNSFRKFVEDLDDTERDALAAGLEPLMQRDEISHLLTKGAAR